MQDPGEQLRAIGCDIHGNIGNSKRIAGLEHMCGKTQPTSISNVSGVCLPRMCPWYKPRYCKLWIEGTSVSRSRALPDGILAASGETNAQTQSQPSTERTWIEQLVQHPKTPAV
jgi:hypothetical protein